MTSQELLNLIKQAAQEGRTNLIFHGNELDKQSSELPAKLRSARYLAEAFPKSIAKIPLEVIEFSYMLDSYLRDASIWKLPSEIGQLTNLTTLDLSNTKLSELPPEIGRLTNLTMLNLGFTGLKELPPQIIELTNLQSLNLRANNLKELPSEIFELTSLQSLNLSANKLDELPPEIGRLTNLTTLDLSNTNLRELPPEVSQLTNLQILNLSANRLSELPPEIGQLTNLTTLDLNTNSLRELPPEIGQLTNLTTLILHDNSLRELPPEIGQLTNLQSLIVDYNRLETPPAEITKQGIEAIRDYFRQREEEGVDYLYEAKLLIVGEPGAGKTTLARKIKNPDAPMPGEEESTQGINIERWQFPWLDKPDFQVNIWDFGGQAIYYATHRFFLTRRSLYVLVADTRKDDTDFFYWLNIVEVLSDKSPVLIIKNEKDDRPREIDEKQLRGQFANLKEVLRANLKTKRGLEEICTHIQQYISLLPHVGDVLPKTWSNVRRELEENPHNYISLQEYLEICERNGFRKHKDKLLLSTYLHELGICLHYQDDPLLSKTIILKTDWCTAAVYKVLDTHRVIENQGQFTRADLDEIWAEDKYALMRDELLRMMVKFQLCYPIPDKKDTYIVPQLLTKDQPDYEWDETDNLLLRYSYEFMPKGILWQFIVVMHRFITEQQLVWRSGIVLEANQTRAEVVEKYGLRRIEIRVFGKYKRDSLTRIRHELEKIHGQYPGLKYEELIPCKCDTCGDSQEPYFYTYQTLKDFISRGKFQIMCHQSGDIIDILPMIDDIESKRFKIYVDQFGNEPDVSEIEHTRELLKINKRRLWKLQERQAQEGVIKTDPTIKIEIEDLESKIRELEEKLK